MKEEEYKKKIEVYNTKIGDFQSNLTKELNSGALGTVIKQMEKEKSNYEMIMSKIKRSSEEIQNYVKKFDVIKEEIDSSNKKFENYKLEIDTKKDSIQLLETQIENIELL